MATVLSYIVLLIYIVGGSLALLKSELFPFGSETYLPPKDDVSSPEIHLTVPIIFYGTEYRSMYVNDNGLLSFLNEVPAFHNGQFPLTHPIIAPLYSDVDIRSSGRVYYRETQAPELLDRAARDIRNHFSTFQPRSLFIATWAEVGCYDRQKEKINTFQVVVASDGEDSYAYFLYPSGGVQWIRGQDKKNRHLPDARAQAGFASGDGRLYTLRGSGTERVRDFDRMSNVKEAGVWMFHIGRLFSVEGNVMPADLDASGDRQDENSRAIRSAKVFPCSLDSVRVDLTDGLGFCCVCKDGYFGNGHNCLEKNSRLMMYGKVTGIINKVLLNDVDLHMYIGTENKRIDTAMTRVPSSIASDLQVLTPLGNLFGWLFAVSNGGAPNGFMITGGVFHRTIEVDFPQSGHHVYIEETFLGPFNHMSVQVKFQGTVPSIPLGTTHIEIPDYEEEYTRIEKGEIRSHSARVYRLAGNSLEVPFTVDQSISYFSDPDCESNMTNTRLEVTKNIVEYDADRQIVRYVMTNKISPFDAMPDTMMFCQDPGVDENGSREPEVPSTPSRFHLGTRVEYTCNQGFDLSGESSIICLTTGEWTASRPRCETQSSNKDPKVHYCENIGVISNGQVTFYPTSGSSRMLQPLDEPEFAAGSRLEYSCDAGYTLLGPKILICENRGFWSNDPPSCAIDRSQRRYCLHPGGVTNGRVEHIPIQNPYGTSAAGRGEYPEGSRLHYSCDHGYTPVGPATLTCKWTGSWSPAVPPTCINDQYKLTCENPGYVLNAIVRYFAPGVRSGQGVQLYTEMEEYPEGSTLEYYCEKGFWLQGSQSLTCDSMGYWSADRPTCVADCGRYIVQSDNQLRSGQEAMVGEWPWVVAISRQGDDNRESFVCGGAIFNTRAVVTAAHCLEEGHTYILRFGKHHFEAEGDDSYVLKRTSSRIITHPDYYSKTFDSDIGLILFDPPIEYSIRVQPICMPTIDSTIRNIRPGRVGYDVKCNWCRRRRRV